MAAPKSKQNRGWYLIFALVAPAFGLIASLSFGARPSNDGAHFYKPARKQFWKNVESLIENKNAPEVFMLEPPPVAKGEEFEEWKLALGKALVASGQPLHAQYWLATQVSQSVATRQGFEALWTINGIAKAGLIDEMAMEELAFDLDTKIDEAEPRSLIGYFKARALQRKNYPDWSAQALKEVAPNTTWSDELEYDRSLQILAAGDAATAYEKFEMISKSPNARKPTVNLSRLALARLIFERRDYKAAIGMFHDADLPVRERARSFQELAWSYYYDKSYGKALGAIQALKSPYFQALMAPETALLEMLIYRELCQYKRVRGLALDFQKTFADVYRVIEDRMPLENVSKVVQASLAEGVMQKRAAVIQMLRQERREIAKQKWIDSVTREQIVKLGETRERMTDLDVQRLLRSRVDEIGNHFLDLREQVWYLEYEASLRLIQTQETATPDYIPPVKTRVGTDTFFWPVNSKEAWLDELLDYEVLVHGSCQATPVPADVDKP